MDVHGVKVRLWAPPMCTTARLLLTGAAPHLTGILTVSSERSSAGIICVVVAPGSGPRCGLQKLLISSEWLLLQC